MRMELVEQPVKAQDHEGMKYVTERVHTPIMADESVFGPTEVIELIESGRLDVASMITRQYALDDVNDAFAAMRDGEVVRGVVVPS